MKIKYQDRNFQKKSLDLIEKINSVIEQYQRDYFNLTLRQCYYQLVARGFIENNQRSYDNIGKLVNNARLAGLIDWGVITDRTRMATACNCSDDLPVDAIQSAADYFRVGKWLNQPNYVEVWVEKEALIDIVARACWQYGAGYFTTRGYCSQTEMWKAAQRFINEKDREGRYIIYLGDHDSSGTDMTRDVADRMKMFGADVEVRRIALTMEQIRRFNPPPAPAKETDSRTKKYIAENGNDVWELDALEPKVIQQLIDSEICKLFDEKVFAETRAIEQERKQELRLIADNYDRIIDFLHL